MRYADFLGERVSLLGFGGMRFPVDDSGHIDEVLTQEMIGYAIGHGVNYFDTAYPYHGGDSERVLGRLLRRYPRDSWLLASKYPGHQIFSTGHDPALIFEEQLEKCDVEYFDFYLLHNVYEGSLPTYRDPRWGIIDYFLEQKRCGRIRHLGFSTHAQLSCLREFLVEYGSAMEFCQIQLNYLDWTLQEGREKLELLGEHHVPVVVMEPLRGGKLASLHPDQERLLRSVRDESPSAWSFRFLQGLSGVKVILSGMSSFEQVRENVAVFEEENEGTSCLSEDEMRLLLSLAEEMKDSLPCTACRYCCESCPAGLDIPALLGTYNDLRFDVSFTSAMRLEFADPDERPEACVECRKCVAMCPQGIDIPAALSDLSDRLADIPKWSDMCRDREKAAMASRNHALGGST